MTCDYAPYEGWLVALGAYAIMLTLVLVAIVVENGWPFGEFYRAKRARAREIRERQALYVRAGLDEYDAKARAEKELATEAKATLAALQ